MGRDVGVRLPPGTLCAGDLAPSIDVPCSRPAEVVVWGYVAAADGSPALAVVAACPAHARFVLRWLRSSAPFPEEIESWGIDAFAEAQRLGVFERNGVDLESAQRIA